MHLTVSFLFVVPLLAISALAKPVNQHFPANVSPSPNLVKRAPGIDPVPYPYGQALANEFLWHGWDPSDAGQEADALKIHNAYSDWANMIYFAIQEADAVSDTFKRWFDASNAQDVKNVFLKMFDPSGVGQPTTLMTRWICERDDIKGACKPTSNAYSVYNKGQFHFCPLGLTKPAADSLTCADLDGFASLKMKSVALTMVHESTHWDQVGDAALGKHIGDVKINGVTANGASDCFNLSPSDKLVNAQNYAYLASEAYFKKKGCTFTDPPPGTTAIDLDDDDLSISPATYNGGWCGIHVTQYQKNEPGDGPEDNNPEYQLSVCVFDGNGVLLNQEPGEPQGACGVFVALNGQPQPIDTALPNILYVTAGAVDSDAVLFNYGDQNWGSNDQEHHSDFGAYDSGSRQGDTGFSC